MGLMNEKTIENQESNENANLLWKLKQMSCWQQHIISQFIHEVENGTKKHIGYVNFCVRRFLSPISDNTKPEHSFSFSLHICPACRRECQSDNIDGFPNKVIIFKSQTTITEQDVRNWLKQKLEARDRWALSHIEIERPKTISNTPDSCDDNSVPF